MRKEDFYFDSRDGKSKLHAVRYLPDEGVNVRGVVQIVHGMAEYVERYEEFAAFLTDNGFVVTGDDHLGHGKSIGENGRSGYFCSQDPATVVVRDVHRLKKLTQALYPNVPYIIMGHSMGSFIVRNYICRYGTGVTAAIIMGTGMQPKSLLRVSKVMVGVQKVFCGPTHVAKSLDKIAFSAYNSKIENPRTPYDWLTKETDRVDKYVADPLCGFTFTVNGFATLNELVLRLYKEELLEKVPKDLPILMVSGDCDPVGDYGKGVQAAFASLRKAGVKDISLKLFQNDRHELLNETDREEVMKYLLTWIEERVVKA